MAFKMKLSSKELDGPYNFSNTHTDAIKSGSGALGESGSIGQMKGGVGLAAPALAKDKKDVTGGESSIAAGDVNELDNVDLPAFESGASRDKRISKVMQKRNKVSSNSDSNDRSKDFDSQTNLSSLNSQSSSDPKAYSSNVKAISKSTNITTADLEKSRRGVKIREKAKKNK